MKKFYSIFLIFFDIIKNLFSIFIVIKNDKLEKHKKEELDNIKKEKYSISDKIKNKKIDDLNKELDYPYKD